MSARYTGGLVYNPPGGWSGSFSGTGQYLTLPSNSAFSFGTGDFTVECWAYFTSVANFPTLTDSRANTSSTAGFNLGLSSAKVQLYTTSQLLIGATTLAVNTWYHIAITRSGTTLRIWLNGFQDATTSNSTNWSDTTFVIGATPNFVNLMTGYISNVRVVKGTAVYTNAFTPPTGALLPITNTSLLTCRYPTFVDGSTNNFTVTNVGTVTAITANPFPTSALPNPALGGAGNGIYTMSQYAALLSAGTWPAYDPYYKNVTLNLHGNAGAVLPFNTDASTNNFQVTQVGNTSPSNYTPFITNGYWSNYFGGSGNSLNYPSAAQYAIGTGNFTLEFFVNFASLNAGHNRMFCIGASGTDGLEVDLNGTNLEVGIQNGYPIGYTWAPTLSTWYYVAVTRSGSTVTLYINGTSVATGTSSNNISQNSLSIGGISWVGSWSINGYLSNVRLSNTVRTIAVPTTPYTSDANTLFLGAQSNRFLDNSSYAATATPTGSPSVNPLQPFTAPTGTSAYGSGYFDGTGDYLQVPASANVEFGSSSFTVEFWWYPTADTRQWFYHATTDYWFGIDYKSSGSFMGLWASSNGSSWNLINADPGGNGISSGTPNINAWNYITVGRSGGTWSLWLNGTRVLNLTGITSAITNRASQAKIIGGWANGSQYLVNGYLSNFRVVIGTDVYGVSNSTITVPTSPLTAITNTSLLTVQTNAPSQNNTFLDSSTNNFPITRFGNTTQGTFTPYGSNWSNYFDGSGDYLRVAYNSNLYPTSSGTDYTVECWVYPTANIGGFTYILGTNNTSVSNWQITNDAGTYGFTLSGVGANAGTVVSNQWAHLAMTRNGTTMNAYLNGVRVYTTTASTQSNNNLPLNIGMRNGSDRAFTGYISNVRIVNGTALYTGASFTVPTLPLTAVTNTTLLTCADNRFIDDSTNNFTITKNGDVSVQRFSPFTPLTYYQPSVIGGSGYFDGSGDYLSSTYYINWSTFGSYTLEFWVYHTSMAAANQTYASTGGTGYTNFYNYSNGRIGLGIQGTNEIVSASGVITANQWYHVAYTYNGTTTTVYVNGVSVASGTTGVYSNNSAVLQIANGLGGLPVYGYMTDFRITKSVVYTGAFTPPTAPLAAIANTSLLLSYTNAAIFDNSIMTDWETLGSAQLNTAYKKYGSGSISMLATGDYCRSTQPSTMGDINGGDFTIEFWVYFTSVAADRALISKYGNAAENAGGLGYVVQWVQSSSVLRLVLGVGGGSDALYTWAWSPVVSTWYHVAVTRSGTSGRAFINGVQIGTTSTLSTSDVASPNATQIGKTHTVGQYLLGYMDDVRVTKGVSRYTANFTPPTSQVQDQ